MKQKQTFQLTAVYADGTCDSFELKAWNIAQADRIASKIGAALVTVELVQA